MATLISALNLLNEIIDSLDKVELIIDPKYPEAPVNSTFKLNKKL